MVVVAGMVAEKPSGTALNIANVTAPNNFFLNILHFCVFFSPAKPPDYRSCL